MGSKKSGKISLVNEQFDTEVKGDLTVDNKPPEKVEEEKPKVELPEIGTKFMINGQEYRVVYRNEGKGRFSSEPCTGVY